MKTSSRTRYHVGTNEIGLDAGQPVECVPDLGAARRWLMAEIASAGEHAQNEDEFEAAIVRLYRTLDVDIVGERIIDAYAFWVRPVQDCACPCDCATTGLADECDGIHDRVAAPDPQLTEPDQQGRSAFLLHGTEYRVSNTASGTLDGFWAVERVTTASTAPLTPEYVLTGQQTREEAFARAVEKLRPYGVLTFLPKRHRDVCMSQEDQDVTEYPDHVQRDGWYCAWSTAGYIVVFEDGTERGIVWPGHPIEAHITGQDGRWNEFDGEWEFWEQAAAAVRAHVLDHRA
ncbi:hypothetical protein ACFT43_05070 [Streptomyces albidoflavus]